MTPRKTPSKTAKPSKTAPSAEPLLQSRPPLERIALIHAQIHRGKYPNCRKLAEELCVAEKTILRDIDCMRDRLRMPIAYDAVRHGYYYTAPVSNVVGLDVSEGEVVALLIAQKALHQHRGTVFEAPLRSACAKLAASLGGTVSVDLVNLDKAISFRETGVTQVAPEVFESVSQAATSCRELSFSYWKLKADHPERRTCHPYHLACINNQWYLFAYDLDREALRTFVLTRMSDASVLTKTFVRPENFSVDQLLASSLDVFRGDGVPKEIRVQFDPWGARLVRERVWHSSQRVKDLPGGSLEITMQLSSLEEVERWILGFAGHARAVWPPELIERMRRSAAELTRIYGAKEP
jgi:predicted DNA-binding transcriptional regulator YafY